jgi:hypothetical protein
MGWISSNEVGRVHDLADLQVNRFTAQDVRLTASQTLRIHQPLDLKLRQDKYRLQNFLERAQEIAALLKSAFAQLG